MRELRSGQTHPELRELVVEASQALARLDGKRLEELALSCHALNRDLTLLFPDERRELTRQAIEAAADMAVFARVLDVTRSNLKVMQRLRELRAGRLDYSETCSASGWKGTEMESEHGDH